MTEPKWVWAVSTIKKDGHGRLVGVYSSLADARDLVENNYGDIYEEGYYPFAVIEQTMVDAVYPPIEKEHWYRWRDRKYRRCGKPAKWKHIVAWGVG